MLIGVPAAPGVGFGPVVHRRTDGAGTGVIVAAELAPGDVASLDPRWVTALATMAGGPLSHASLLARSLGIPAVTGLGPELLDLPEGTVVLVDGDAGTVHVAPYSDTLETARARQRETRRQHDDARAQAGGTAVTRDGLVVPVLVNVGSSDDARLAVRGGADGVGMLRTEFAFLNRTEPPGEDEQYDAYRGVAEALGERPLVVRTLDLGADVPAWDAEPEPNPALGHRGIRLTLARRDLLTTQLRAVARLAGERPIGLMFPMVTSIGELREARRCLDEADHTVRATQAGHGVPATQGGGGLEVGITVEVPAAAITAEVFAPLVDFFAIGTNDLTQYTLAADRANARVAAMADGLHPAVLRLVRAVTAAGQHHGRPVCVVGELACDRHAIPVLLGLGVSTLSVRPNAVAAVKQVVREVALDDARALAEAALAAESAAAVRALVSRSG